MKNNNNENKMKIIIWKWNNERIENNENVK